MTRLNIPLPIQLKYQPSSIEFKKALGFKISGLLNLEGDGYPRHLFYYFIIFLTLSINLEYNFSSLVIKFFIFSHLISKYS